MSNLVADHPTPDQLRAFGLGRLDAADFTAIEEHISECNSCCRALDQFQADSFVGRLKSAERAAFATTADGSAATLLDPPDIPAELANHPRYRVLGLIGQGGMGAVYQAEHRRMQRIVALKVINPGLMRNPATVNRFQQEVRATAKLSHPNIVTAHDADQAGELHFLVMEFVEGQTLGEVLDQRGLLPIAEVCDYVCQAAQGLQHLHESGLIHRDIKPHNLMLTTSGTVKLLDCGLARFADDAQEPECETASPFSKSNSSLTAAGTVMGTADYIAPEQVADARAADIRSDIYSLGCTLYHLLTGKPPFPEGTPADKFNHHTETPIPIPEEWPPELKSIVGKMTAKKPGDRYATPAEVAKDISSLGQAPSVGFGRAGSMSDRRKPSGRSRSRLAMALFALAALIVAAVIIIRIPTDKGEVVIQTDDPNIEIVTKKGGEIVRIRDPKTGQAWELNTKNLTMRDLEHPDGFTIVLAGRGSMTFKSAGGKVVVSSWADPLKPYVADPRFIAPGTPAKSPFPTAEELAQRFNAADALKPGDVGQRERLLVSAKPGEAFNDSALVAVLGETQFRIPTETEGVNALKYSPDGKYLMAGCLIPEDAKFDKSGKPLATVWPPRESHVSVFDTATGKQLSSMKCIDFAAGPDGLIALALERTIEIRTMTGEFKRKFDIPAEIAEVAVIAWSPNGKTIAIGDAKKRYVVGLSADEGQLLFADGVSEKKANQAPEFGTARLRFSPDSEVLVMNWTDGLATVHDLRPGRKLNLPTQEYRQIVFGRDGNVEAVLARDAVKRPLIFFNAKGEKTSELDISGSAPIRLDSVNGVVFVTSDDLKQQSKPVVLRVNPETGKVSTQARIENGADLDLLAVSPDGKTLAVLNAQAPYHRRVVEFFDVTTGKPVRPPSGHVRHVTQVVFSPDGKKLASVGDDGRVLFWDLATGKLIRKAKTPPGVRRVAFSSDPRVYGVAGMSEGKVIVDFVELRSMANDEVLHRNDTNTLPLHVTNLLFSPDGKYLAATSNAGIVWAMSTLSGETVCREEILKPDPITFTPDAAHVLVMDGREIVHVFKIKEDATANGAARPVNGREETHVWRLIEGRCSCLSFLPDGETMVIPRALGTPGVVFLDWRTGKVVKEISQAPSGSGKFEVNALGPAGRLAAMSFFDDQTRDRGCLVRDLNAQPVRDRFFAVKSSGSTKAYVFSPDGRYLAVPGPGGLISLLRLEERRTAAVAPVRVTDPAELASLPNAADVLQQSDIPEDAQAYLGGGEATETPSELVAVLGDTRFRVSDTPGPMAFSPGGKQLAVSNQRDEIRFLDAQTGRFLRLLTTSYAPKERMAFSPDGRYLMGTNAGGEFNVFDAATGQLRWKLTETELPSVNRFVATADGKTIVLCSDKAPPVVEEHAAATGKLKYTLDVGREALSDLALSPDLDTFVSIRRDGGAVTFQKRSKSRELLVGKRGVRVAFGPDGKHFAVLWTTDKPGERTVTIHDADAKVLHTLPGPAGGLAPENECLAFAPDGKTLIAVSSGMISNCMRWDVVQGKILSSWELPKENRTHFNVLSPDGKRVARRCVVTCRIDIFDTETGKPLSSRVGHERSISSLAFSPDGRYLASTDRFATRLWDLATAREIPIRFEHAVHHLTFSPDGKILVGATADFLCVFRIQDGAWLRRLEAKTHQIDSIAFNPDGSLIAAGCGDDVRVWRVEDGKEVRILGNQNHVFGVAFSLDGSKILAAGDGIKIWDTHTGSEIKHLEGSRYYRLEWLPDGKTLAATHTEGWDMWGYVLHIDPENCEILKRIPARILYPSDVTGVFPHALSPGARFLCLCEDGGFRLMQPFVDPTRRRMFRLAPSPTNWIVSQRTAAFSPDGRYLACGNSEGVISLLRLSEQGKVPDMRLMAPSSRELAERPNAADELKHKDIPEIARAYVGGGDTKNVPPELVAVLGDARFRCPHAAGPPAFSADGKLLAVPSNDKVLVFDAATGRSLRTLSTHLTSPIKKAIFSPDGRALLLLGGKADDELIDATTGKQIWPGDSHLSSITSAAFHPGGKSFLVWNAEPGMLEFRDSETGKSLGESRGPFDNGVSDVAFQPDGAAVFVATVDGAVRTAEVLVNKDGGIGYLGGHENIPAGDAKGSRVAFSRDGKCVAVWPGAAKQNGKMYVLSRGGAKRLHTFAAANVVEVAFDHGSGNLVGIGWNAEKSCTVLQRCDPATGKELAPVSVPELKSPGGKYMFSPAGSTLAVIEKDGDHIVRVLDTKTGKQLVNEQGHARGVQAIAFSPDGKHLASSDRYVTKLWDLATAREIATWKHGENPIQRLAFGPDGTLLACAGASWIWVHRVSDGKQLQVFQAKTGWVVSVAFSPDGSLIAGAGEGDDVRVWRVSDGKQLRILEYPEHARGVTFSPDGSKLIAVGRHGIRVWDSVTGLESKDFLWECDCQLLDWLPDGKTLAVYGRGTTGNGIRHVDPDTGKVIRPQSGFELGASAYATSPGARFLCACEVSGFVITQLGPDPQRRRVLRFGFSNSARAAAFSPDGRYLACGNSEGVISLLRLSERGQLPSLPIAQEKNAAEPEVLPQPREQAPPKKPIAKPLAFELKFPANLFLVRVKVKEIDRTGVFGAPEKYRFVIEQVFAGEDSLKGKMFTYQGAHFLGSGPPDFDKPLLFGMEVGTEMLWWIRPTGRGVKLPLPQGDVGEFVPILDAKELEHHAIELFPYVKSVLGAGIFGSYQPWEDGLEWAQKVQEVYRAKSPQDRGQILRRLAVHEQRHIARWATALLCNSASEESRKDIRQRAERDAMSSEDALLIDRMLCRLDGGKWFETNARVVLLTAAFDLNEDVDFDLACRRLSHAARDYEIDFATFAKVINSIWPMPPVLTVNQQWSLGRTLLETRFDLEPTAVSATNPAKPKPYGLLKPEDRAEMFDWLLGISEKARSNVLHLHAAMGLKHLRPFSDKEKERITAVLSQRERGHESHDARQALFQPIPTHEDETVARRTAHLFAKESGAQQHTWLAEPFYRGGWLVPRATGWELPVSDKSNRASSGLEVLLSSIPSQVTTAEFLDVRPYLTRDPFMKEIARFISREKGFFYVVTLRGNTEVQLLIRVEGGQGRVRGVMPMKSRVADPLEAVVRDTALQFVKAHNTKDGPRLKELVVDSWCHGGKLMMVIDQKTELKMFPNPTFGRYGSKEPLGIQGYGPKFPVKLPETILQVMPYRQQRLALLSSAKEVRELDNFMGERGYVVFLGNHKEGGGIALLVRVDKDDAKKDVVKIVGTMNGLQ
jgi:WD40 repeat protein